MRSVEENKSLKGNQGPIRILMDTMAQIELITCNISILTADRNRGDKGLESISLEVDILRKNINECIELLSSSNSQRMDNSNSLQIAKELKVDNISTNPGQMTTILMAAVCQKGASDVPIDKILKKPMRQNRPNKAMAETIKNDPKLDKTIPDNKGDRQLGLTENAIVGRKSITINGPVVPGAHVNAPQPGTGPCKGRSPFFNDGPFLLEDCKLPLGKKVTGSLENLGILVR